MSENPITPFRVATAEMPKPISEDTIPDCGRSEIAMIRSEIGRLDAEIEKIKSVPFDRCLKATFPLAVVLGVVFVVSVATTFWTVIACSALAALLVCICAAIMAGIASLFFSVPPAALQLQEECEPLRKRLQNLQSLDRLTGKSERVQELLGLVRAFNRDVTALEGFECSEKDRRAIEDARAKIVREIRDFRAELMEDPDHEPKALSSGVARLNP